jgi:hypothetical protein
VTVEEMQASIALLPADQARKDYGQGVALDQHGATIPGTSRRLTHRRATASSRHRHQGRRDR